MRGRDQNIFKIVAAIIHSKINMLSTEVQSIFGNTL